MIVFALCAHCNGCPRCLRRRDKVISYYVDSLVCKMIVFALCAHCNGCPRCLRRRDKVISY